MSNSIDFFGKDFLTCYPCWYYNSMYGGIIMEEWQLCFQYFFKKYLFICLNVSFCLLMTGKLSKIRIWSAFCFSVKKVSVQLWPQRIFSLDEESEKEVKNQISQYGKFTELHIYYFRLFYDCQIKSSMRLVSVMKIHKK